MRRFDPAYADAKRRIDAGEIGKPIYYKGFTRDRGAPPAEFIKHSGGIFIDCSIHDYDMARYLLGAEITSVSGHGRILKNPFMEQYGDVDQALTYLEFDSGAAGMSRQAEPLHTDMTSERKLSGQRAVFS